MNDVATSEIRFLASVSNTPVTTTIGQSIVTIGIQRLMCAAVRHAPFLHLVYPMMLETLKTSATATTIK
jgi:hypothetical protein